MRVSGLDLVRPSHIIYELIWKGKMDVIPNWYYYLIHYIGILNYVDWFGDSVSQVIPNEGIAHDRCPILPTLCSR